MSGFASDSFIWHPLSDFRHRDFGSHLEGEGQYGFGVNMANRTVKDAHSVKGTNPQYLVEKIIRSRIYECRYWKEQCFALSAELLVDKAMELKYLGGVYGGNIKPTPFICLVLKMLQIQPEKDIVIEFISQQEFKYVRALGAIYMRLVGTSLDCYKYLEPLYNDYRKIKKQDRNGVFHLLHMDEFIDELLREERSCDVILPRIQKRQVLEETNQLEPRISFLDEDMDDMDEEEEEEMLEIPAPVQEEKRPPRSRRSPSPRHRRSSRSPKRREGDRRHRSRSRERQRDRGRDHQGRDHQGRDHHRERPRSRERLRSRSRERHRPSDMDRHRAGDDDRHRSSGHRHRHENEDDRHRHHRSKRSKRDRSKERDLNPDDPDIREANELRAKLGLPPLKM